MPEKKFKVWFKQLKTELILFCITMIVLGLHIWTLEFVRAKESLNPLVPMTLFFTGMIVGLAIILLLLIISLSIDFIIKEHYKRKSEEF